MFSLEGIHHGCRGILFQLNFGDRIGIMGPPAHHTVEVPVLLGLIAAPLHGVSSIAKGAKGSVLWCGTKAVSSAEEETNHG